MTRHELEQFLERAWNDPAWPPAHIPAEMTQYALERGRRVRSCELKRVLLAIGKWLREWRGARRPGRRAAGLPRGAVNPC